MKNTLVLSITVFALITGFTWASTIGQIAMLSECGHAASDAAIILSTTGLVADSSFKSFQIRDLSQAFTMENVSLSEQVSKSEAKMEFKGGFGAIMLRKR